MAKSPWAFWVGRMDLWLLLMVLMLMAIGVLFIYSAAWVGDGLPVPGFYRRQMIWGTAGLVGYFAMMRMDYRQFASAAWFLYAVGLAMLVLVLFVGESAYGATRWLNLLGLQVQPSEFAKLSTLIALARYLTLPGTRLGAWKTLLVAGVIVGVPFLLIQAQPDLGTAAVLLPIAAAMVFAAGLPLRRLVLLGCIGLMLLPLGWFFALGNYQQERVRVFFDPGRDPLGAGWNKIQSEIAVGSGGLMGKGYLEGTQNVLGFLPRSVAPTDFIYSVIAEETGFVGSALVLSLYAGVLLAIGRAALVSRDKLGRLLAVGVAALLFSHIAVNIAMTIGLMPITGLPLPLISYGGSFMVGTLCALGLVQSVFVRRIHR